VALGLALALAGPAVAQFAAPQIGDKESGVQKIAFIDDGKPLSNMTWTITRTTRDGKPIIRKELSGEWFKSGSGPITWKEESVFEIVQGRVRTLSWHKQSAGAEKETFQLDYDWNARTLHLYYFDALSGKKKDKKIVLDGEIIAGDAMELMMRGFPFDKGEGFTYTARVVMADGSFLGGSIVHRGEETITTPLGKLPCYKLELKPTGALGFVAPKMYYWLTKKAPHILVRYEGRDNGPFDPRTLNDLTAYQPAEWVKP
jgi:hypothetical protein